MTCATLEGEGLHGGVLARVRLVGAPGRVRLRSNEVEAVLDELIFDGDARSTRAATRDGRLRVGTVEHLFSALGAASVHEGVAIEIDGPEVPLLDGGARTFADALKALAAPPAPPRLVVVRRGSIDVGASRYELAPGDRVRVEVEVDFDDPRLARHAAWDGDPDDFRERVAPARTFALAREIHELVERGLARHVAPESVVVIASGSILSAGRAFTPDEPARHKLLDLIGDLYAHGGPPLGSVRATRPGHAATHSAIGRAIAEGLLARDRTR